MTRPLLDSRDIGSGPRYPGIIGLNKPGTLTEEQVNTVVNFIHLVENLPKHAYGVTEAKVTTSLADTYVSLAHTEYEKRVGAAADFMAELGVTTLRNLGFGKLWDLEWLRSEMVEWEGADVEGLKKSNNWQRSYGYKFWKPREIDEELRYAGESERHVEELKRVQRFAEGNIRVPLTDPHCVIHANDNIFYYSRELEKGKEPSIASLSGDHEAGRDFARKVSLNRVKNISKNARPGETIDIQWDNFIVACETKEFDKGTIKRMKLKAPSFIVLLNEVTPRYPNIEYSIHNCLQPYQFYVPYLPVEVPNVTGFHFEISADDTNKRGLTKDQRTGRGWEAIRQLKEYGLRKHQKIIVDVASSYEGAQSPNPEVVRDKILYPILRLGYAPEQVQVAPACGQRNLSLERMLEIDVNIHRGRDLALKHLEKEFGIDATPHLTRSRLGKVRG